MSTAITPFSISIPQADLDDLHHRIALARWPEKETVADWSQGVPLARLRSLVDHWQYRYDWRAREARLNAWPQFRTEIDGLDIHFLHVRSPHEGAMPLIMTHGWPGSVVEFMEVIAPLTDPVAYGGSANDAFDVVAPSLPGYGFSGKPTGTGWGIERIAAAWATLMQRLGYARWVAQGGDWGSAITNRIGIQRPDGCIGVHLNMPVAHPSRDDLANLTEKEAAAAAALRYYKKWDSGYAKQQSTRPQTLGYGLADSPVAQAAWIYEKLQAWTDNDGAVENVLSLDTMLDNIMLYWLTNSGASSARLYWESFTDSGPEGLTLDLPSGVSAFPKEVLRTSRKWAERKMTNIIYWNDVAKGGHFAAWEQPALFVEEVRACFRLMR